MLLRKNTKPFIILSFSLALSCLFFWLSLRYPGLNAKAIMGPSASLSSLGFEPIIIVDQNASFFYKVFAETINWVDTNKRGMSFAFIVGAFFLSIAPLLKRPQTTNGFVSSIYGLTVGAPLGVCVNCAAPIAKSALASGSSAQFALALLISSPSLNIVVIFMAFTLFPAYAVILKIFLTLFFILLLVPFGVSYVFKDDIEQITPRNNTSNNFHHNTPAFDSWLQSLTWSASLYFKNLFYLIKMTLPLMILAGFLGALLSISVPWETINNLDATFSSWFVIFFIMIMLSLFGTFLPSPISFDVVLSSALLLAGVPIYYVMIFLFTLGSFSIYAFFIIWQSISLRAALYMYLCTTLMGFTAGVVSYYAEIVRTQHTSQKIEKTITERTPKSYLQDEYYDRIRNRTDKSYDYKDIQAQIKNVNYQNIETQYSNIQISKSPLDKKDKFSKKFDFLLGDQIGIEHPYEISYLSFIPTGLPFATTGIASGDVHNDGWSDILLIGDLEIVPNLILFTNINGSRFVRQSLPDFGFENAAITANIIDLDGDNWKDIFITTLDGKAYILQNIEGSFSKPPILIQQSNSIGMSVSFGDIEGDGDIDIFVGNWSAGPEFINLEASRNYILLSKGNFNFDRYDLQGLTGETLTSLFHDFNQDGMLDLYVGNDHEELEYSDQIFLGSSNGQLKPPHKNKIKGFVGAHSSMSIDIGDIDNDLLEDYYLAQIAYSGELQHSIRQVSARQINIDDYCKSMNDKTNSRYETCEVDTAIKKALGRVAFQVQDECYALSDPYQKTKCFIHYNSYKHTCFVDKHIFDNTDFVDRASPRYQDFCAKLVQKEDIPEISNKTAGLLKTGNIDLANILLRNTKKSNQNIFVDVANERKVNFGAWSWNSRFVDLDNDGWQDIYVANGFSYPMTRSMNLYYRNQGNGYFENESTKFNLDSFSSTSSYTIVDFNNDGAQDIIAVPTDSPVEVFKSNTSGNAIRFILHDTTRKNSQAIGAKLIISYTQDGETKRQMQIIKASGGYRAFNEPIIHFGLGDIDKVQKIEIQWPDNSKDKYDLNLDSGYTYILKRI